MGENIRVSGFGFRGGHYPNTRKVARGSYSDWACASFKVPLSSHWSGPGCPTLKSQTVAFGFNVQAS